VAGAVREWLVDRFALKPILDHFLNRRVPRAPWYSGDGAALLSLIGVQVITGAMLALTYSPAADSAYESVVHITERQLLGWFVRGLHYWSAGMIMVVLLFHLCRQILLAGYKPPREATWLIGVLMLFCILFMSYSGYLLRWDERGVHGTQVMLHMLSRVPLVGERLVLLMQGGPDMGPQTLTRLYALHVILVPLAIVLLAGYHLYLVVARGTITRAERRQPVSTAEEQKALYKEESQSERGGEWFFPATMIKSGTFSALVFAIAAALTLVRGPAPLYPEGNFVQESMPAEEWWYWWYSGLIALLPPSVAPWFVVIFPIAGFMFLVGLPFFDRGPARGLRRRPIWAIVVLLLVAAVLFLTDYRRRSAFTGWPDPNPPALPAGVQLTAEAEHGRVLFARYGCNSCHGIAGEGRKVGPDFARLEKRLSREEIRNYVLRPPPDVPMPAYDGRLAGDELERVVEFCHVAQTFPRRL
jgi:ubiquinol-cytochrome c reductase cytochrome b subunit